MMLSDATEAIQLDDTYIKAFMAMGEALIELGKLDDTSCTQIEKGLQRFEKARKLSTQQNKQQYVFKHIDEQILKGRKIQFYKQRELEDNEHAALLSELKQKIARGQPFQPQFDELHVIERFENIVAQRMQSRYKDVPDHLKGAISDELMEDPVIIQSGNTYDLGTIKKHFEVAGAFDPLTRQEVDPKVLIPNHKLKQATDQFVL